MTSRAPHRLLSLDVFRGLTIAGMILVNSPGNGTAYAPLEHAEWNGWTPTDLVFPFFVFILGISLVFSSKNSFAQIFKRTLLIFFFGLLLNGFPYNHLESIRIPGVLQRLALCYFFAAVIYRELAPKAIAILSGVLLFGYWLVMRSAPLTPEANIAAVIDRFVFGRHIYTPLYDPEGILSTIPAVVTALIGVLTGVYLKTNQSCDDAQRGCAARRMVIVGSILVIAGEIWNFWFPINKALWTSSFVLFMGGLALILLAFCYWLIDIKGIKTGTKFFEVFGVNALAAYMLPLFLLKTLNRIPMTMPDGTTTNARLFFTHHVFESWMSPMNASLCFAVGHVLLWFFIFSWFYRKRIFLKV